MTNITLKQLRYFEAVASAGHFGRAADLCGVSQPAISVQIRDLETELGMALFERTARQVTLTGFGVEFAPRASAVLRSVDDLGALARAAQGTLTGPFRLGIIPTIAPYLLPRLIGELSSHHPTLDLHIRESMTDRLIADLTDGRLDTAIMALPVSEPALSELALFDEDFVLVRHQNEETTPIPDPQQLSEMRLLLLEEGHCFRDQALSFCATRSLLPRQGMDGSALSTLVQMVGAGIGVTLIPEMAVPIETRSAPVVVSHFAKAPPGRTLGLVWRKASPMAAQFEQLGAHVLRASGR